MEEGLAGFSILLLSNTLLLMNTVYDVLELSSDDKTSLVPLKLMFIFIIQGPCQLNCFECRIQWLNDF